MNVISDKQTGNTQEQTQCNSGIPHSHTGNLHITINYRTNRGISVVSTSIVSTHPAFGVRVVLRRVPCLTNVGAYWLGRAACESHCRVGGRVRPESVVTEAILRGHLHGTDLILHKLSFLMARPSDTELQYPAYYLHTKMSSCAQA